MFKIGQVEIRVFDSKTALGAEAARQAASVIRRAIADREWARIIVAAGNSQIELVESLTRERIDWNYVEVFHMDEYLGMPEAHVASFRRWVKQRLSSRVRPARVHYLAGDAADIASEMRRYSRLLSAKPIDLAFVGFGENGHIAFNDPLVADFQDPEAVKRVRLDEISREQQLNEGHFPSMEMVPKEAITLTCPALMGAETWICSVPDQRKAKAVRCALEGPISSACPASLVRIHPNAFLYLDEASASLLTARSRFGGQDRNLDGLE